jgi:hypothetical protein
MISVLQRFIPSQVCPYNTQQNAEAYLDGAYVCVHLVQMYFVITYETYIFVALSKVI